MARRRSPRWRATDSPDPGAVLRRGELAAGLATAAIAGQLLFAPAVLLATTALVVVGRVSRWRPLWLAVPTAASVIWLLVVGLRPAVAALATGLRRRTGLVLVTVTHPRVLAHPGVMAAAASRWLGAGLPLALVSACAEAGFVLWLGWWRPTARLQSRWRWRSGLVTAVRHRISAAALRAGRTTTRDGCAVGVATNSGALAGFTWAEAMSGVLLTGQDRHLSGLAITSAALRRRKTVVVLECAGPSGPSRGGGRGEVTERVGRLARSLGVRVSEAGAGSSAAAIGRAVRRRETVLIATHIAAEAQRAAADLIAVLSHLGELGLRADCVAWIDGAEFVDPACVGELLALGPLTGTAVVLSTADSAAAAQLAAGCRVLAVGQLAGIDVEFALAARMRGGEGQAGVLGRESATNAQLVGAHPPSRPTKQGPSLITLIVFSSGLDGSPWAVTHCRLKPITLDQLR